MNTYNAINLSLDNVSVEVLIADQFFAETYKATLDNSNTHTHSHIELFFVGSDPLTLSTENGNYVYQNSVVAIPSGIRHFVSERKHCYAFMFKFIKKTHKNNELASLLEEYFSKDRIISISQNEKLLFYLYQLQEIFKNKTSRSQLKVESLLTLILLEVFDAWQIKFEQKQKTRSNRSDYIYIIEQTIGNDFNQDLSLKTLAKKLYLSEKQTSRFIRKEYGKTFSTLLNEKRLLVGKTLLKNTDMSVAEIINYLNFKTENYFFAQFKKKFGTTPLAYRKGKTPKAQTTEEKPEK